MNLSFPAYYSGEFPLMNYVKLAGEYFNGAVLPNEVDDNGFPTTAAANNLARQLYVPSQDRRPGNYVWRWTGDPGSMAFNATSVTGVSGSLSGGDGRYVFTPTGSPTNGCLALNIGWTNLNLSAPVTSMAIVHEDDEAAWLSGSIFNTTFLNRVSNFGLLRLLDWQNINSADYFKWSHLHNEAALSYCIRRYLASTYRGTTTNVGDAYSIAWPGFVLTDRAEITLIFNSNAIGDSGTLNVNFTGDVPIKWNNCDSTGDTTRPHGDIGRLVYDATLGCWMLWGGGSAQDGVVLGSTPGIPPSIALKLGLAVGADIWFHVPHLALGTTASDFTHELATLNKTFADSYAPWMKPWYEPSNEFGWNGSRGFAQSPWGQSRENAQPGWTGHNGGHGWYGRMGSLMGAELMSVYGSASRFNQVCGVQAAGYPDTSSSCDRRLAGEYVTVDGGTPASTYATHICPAIYSGVGLTYTPFLQAAYDYSVAVGTPAKNAVIDAYFASADSVGARTRLQPQLAAWGSYATGKGKKMGSYEGGFGWDFSSVSASITALSNASHGVVRISGSDYPPIGSSVSISGTSGSTGANGQTATVLSVNTGTGDVTTDRNTTSDGTYTSGGTLTFVNAQTYQDAFATAARPYAEGLSTLIQGVFTQFVLYGGEYPSLFDLAGTGPWAKCFPTIFDPGKEFEGAVAFSTGAKPLKLSLTG